MTADQLKYALKSKYNLLCFVDLADIKTLHGAVYNLFQQHYSAEFDCNQRFVFYSEFEPEQQLINHIQKAATLVDIGNYFILLVTPYDLKEKLKIANHNFSNDEVCIGYNVVKIKNTKKIDTFNIAKDYNTLCAYPFYQLYISGSTVLPCCKFNLPEGVGDLTKNTTEEIFFGDAMQSIRNRMLNGEKIPECSICWETEEKQCTSLRTHGLTLLDQELNYRLVDQPENKSISHILSNTCNFSCRICEPYASSKIAAEELLHNNDADTKNLILKIKNHYASAEEIILNNVPKTFQNTRMYQLLGGEPLLWKNLPILLEELVKLEYSKKIHFMFHTNGSIFPNKIFSLLDNFNKVTVSISIDDIGDRFKIQRGGSWDKVCKNLDLYLKRKSDSFDIQIAVTVNIQNLLYLDELVSFCESRNLTILWTYLENPKFLCIDFITEQTKAKVVSKYSDHKNTELRAIAHRVQQTLPVSGQDFLAYTKKLDSRRSQNFAAYHKEIFDAMSG